MRNRALVHPDRVRALFNEMKQQLQEMAERHANEQRRLRAELEQVHAALRELRAASLRRAQAHDELVSLYRERAIQRARAAERDPAAALN